jgi:hypothetical protein
MANVNAIESGVICIYIYIYRGPLVDHIYLFASHAIKRRVGGVYVAN